MSAHLVFVCHSGQRSGAESVMLRLADHALRNGDLVTIACPEGPLTTQLPQGAEHLPLPALGLHGGAGVRRVVAILRLLLNWAVAGWRLRGLDGQLIVNSLFALPAVRFSGRSPGATWLVHDTLNESKQRIIVRFSASAVTLAVAVSESTAQPLREAGLTVQVIPNGVRWPVAPVDLTVGEPPVVGVLALLTPWKGHRVLLEAVARLDGVRLAIAGGVFAGEAWYEDELRARAAEPDLAGRVDFLGVVDAESTMRGWTALVSPSSSPEAGPLGVLEAMSLGLPVVGTDHGGTHDYLRDGAGLLVEPNDPGALAAGIARIVRDDALRAQCAAVSRARVAADHDLSVVVPRMLDALTLTPAYTSA